MRLGFGFFERLFPSERGLGFRVCGFEVYVVNAFGVQGRSGLLKGNTP